MSRNMTMMNRDLARLNKKLMGVSEEFTWDIMKDDLEGIANGLVDSIQSKVPVSDKAHHRYDGEGSIVATYNPGNLKRSIQILKHLGSYAKKGSKRMYGLYVGVLIGEMGTRGEFQGSRVDGWYARFIEFGAMQKLRDGTRQWLSPKPFLRPTYDQMKQGLLNKMSTAYKRKIDALARKFNK